MRRERLLLAALLARLLLAPQVAAADQEVSPKEPPIPDRTAEITVDVGYTQGTGNIGAGLPSLTDTVGPGVQAGVGFGYRFSPAIMLGVYGTGAVLSRGGAVGTTAMIETATAGVEFNVHMLPRHRVHPWLGLASGWRGLWIDDQLGNDFVRQGFELARLQVGVDLAAAPGVTVSPVIGADLSLFVTQQLPGQGGFSAIASPAINTFFFAGVLGRFDFPSF